MDEVVDLIGPKALFPIPRLDWGGGVPAVGPVRLGPVRAGEQACPRRDGGNQRQGGDGGDGLFVPEDDFDPAFGVPLAEGDWAGGQAEPPSGGQSQQDLAIVGLFILPKLAQHPLVAGVFHLR